MTLSNSTRIALFFVPIPVLDGRWGLLGPRALGIAAVAALWVNTTFWDYGLRHMVMAIPAMFSAQRREEWVSVTDRTPKEAMDHHLRLLAHLRENDPLTYSAEEVDGLLRSPSRIDRFMGHLAPLLRPGMALMSFIGRKLLLVFRIPIWYGDTTPVNSRVVGQGGQTGQPANDSRGWFRRAASDVIQASKFPRFQRMLVALVLIACWITNTEITIRANWTAEANDWGFGQIFAMAATVPILARFIKLALRFGAKDHRLVLGTPPQ